MERRIWVTDRRVVRTGLASGKVLNGEHLCIASDKLPSHRGYGALAKVRMSTLTPSPYFHHEKLFASKDDTIPLFVSPIAHLKLS
jgi:hypothetical protein